MTEHSVSLTLNCVISAKLRIGGNHRSSYCALASVLPATGKSQLVLCFKHFANEQVLANEDFNVDSV